MKKFILFFAMIWCFVFSAYSQFTEINGISKTKKASAVKLFKVMSGQLEEINSTNPTSDGKFNFKFLPTYKGYYVIGFGNAKEVKDKFKLYVKGNDKINLVLNDSTYVLTGINTKENEVLAQWQKLALKIERRSVYFMPRFLDGFFPQLENLILKSKNWTVGKETGNAEFDKLLKTTIDYDIAYFALSFISSFRASQPNPADYNAYMKNFKADPFLQNSTLLKLPYGTIMLSNLVSYKNNNLRKPDFDIDVMAIANDTLKGQYTVDKAATLKSYTNYEHILRNYQKYILNQDQLMQLNKIESNLAKFKAGASPINFAYPDVEGKIISLADFKGKLVLVDVWATWCGPCVAEIPSLKKLEEEFHDKDIAFVSVTIDIEKDKEKWKKFIVDNQLGGVQLFANGGNSIISKAYQISGIPRFMLFDKKGNIIDVDSPRPSDPKLKAILNEYLSN